MMAREDRMQDRMARREAEREARRAERMAERLSRMADRPMRTPDVAPMVSRRPAPIQPTPGQTFGAFSPDLATPFRPRFVDGDMGGFFPAPVARPQNVAPGQSYGSWLSKQIRSGVDFGEVDPRSVYNSTSDRPLPGVEAAPLLPVINPQMPTQPGGKGGGLPPYADNFDLQRINGGYPVQMPTQPGGKGAAAPAGLGALGLYRGY